jgi:hypothetical protein
MRDVPLHVIAQQLSESGVKHAMHRVKSPRCSVERLAGSTRPFRAQLRAAKTYVDIKEWKAAKL